MLNLFIFILFEYWLYYRFFNLYGGLCNCFYVIFIVGGGIDGWLYYNVGSGNLRVWDIDRIWVLYRYIRSCRVLC